MANPFDDDYESLDAGDQQIKEGLICPVCLQDFARVNQLQDHFLSAHADEANSGSGSSNNIGTQLKGLIGKAKKKILKDERLETSSTFDAPEESTSRVLSVIPPSLFYSSWRENQVIGQNRSHFEHLKEVRDRRVERYVIETNKLLIRLDKLISDAPTDLEKRKQHEKNVVLWVCDSDVKLCPSCAKSFNITRRRHHCRLCGGIMCHNCSEFLEFDYARKLISPTSLEDDGEPSSFLAPKEGVLSKSSSRRGSTSSLMSVVNSATGEQHVRVCYDCKVLLDRRHKQIEDQRSKPLLCNFYDRMKQSMEECDKLIPVYYRMCNSFSLGETSYNLSDAHDLRKKLMKLAETVDALSRKIATLGADEDPLPPTPRLQLQAKLRLTATQFLREKMIGLPSLPTAEDLQKLQEERHNEIQRKILLEKQQALEEQARVSRHSSPNNARYQDRLAPNSYSNMPRDESSSSFELVSPDNGWGPECDSRAKPSKASGDSDPMLLQINRVRSYIKHARQEHRYDEVNMLEANLRELEIEYFVQQQEQSQPNGDEQPNGQASTS